MGLFSKKKKIMVSSVTYNLAGDIKNRVKFLPTAVAGHILTKPANASIAETIVNSLIGGPAMKFRRFSTWAESSGFNDLMQITAGSIKIGGRVSFDALKAQIPLAANEEVDIQTAEVGVADYSYWADQYMVNNHPTEVEGDYEIDMNENTNTIFIRFQDGRVFSFNPAGFDVNRQYLYYSYIIKKKDQKLEVITQPTVSLGNQANWPDVTGYQFEGGQSTTQSMTLYTTTTSSVSYSDGRPGSSNTSQSSQQSVYDDTDYDWYMDDYAGQEQVGDAIASWRNYQRNTTRSVKKSQTYSDVQTYDDGTGTGNTVTYTTITTVEYRDFDFYYTLSRQKVLITQWSPLRVAIYGQNTGNPSLDALFDLPVSSSPYFPFIAVRVNNRFQAEGVYRDANIKALKHSMDASYNKLEKSLEATPNLKDIDNAYIMFGVPLNTKEPACRKYMFKFFEGILNQGAGGTAAMTDWQRRWAVANRSRLVWISWKQAQSDPSNALYGTPEPAQQLYPPAPTNSLNMHSSLTGFNITVSWQGISKISGTGLGKPDARVGDCWVTKGATQDYTELMYTSGIVGSRPASSGFITITWQLTANTYESIGVWGLHHTNIVYKGKGVDEDTDSAMADTDESSFLIPINSGIFKSMSLKDSTQMANSMGYMVLNCYTVVKQKWYQTSWFKIILIIIVIVVTVITAGAGGASAGLLGSSAAVGAAAGAAAGIALSATAALIVGTIANALAAMLLMQIITMGATALFGEKVGAIVGVVASVVAISVGTAYMGGQGIAAGFSNLTTAESLLKLTIAAGDGYSKYMGAVTSEKLDDINKLMDSYEQESSKIEKLYEQNIGYGVTFIDTMSLTDATVGGGKKQEQVTYEGPQSFFARTLMTGSEIVDMQQGMLTNFASITTSTQLS